MIEFTPLQLVGGICILLSSGILIGAIIGYYSAQTDKENQS